MIRRIGAYVPEALAGLTAAAGAFVAIQWMDDIVRWVSTV